MGFPLSPLDPLSLSRLLRGVPLRTPNTRFAFAKLVCCESHVVFIRRYLAQACFPACHECGIFEEMHKLDSLTLRLKDSMNEMSDGVMQINSTVQEVDDLAKKNDLSIKRLAHEVKKFKI